MWALYTIKFYVTARGECPFQAFLDGAQPTVKAMFIRLLDLLARQGPDSNRPYADVLRDGIRELRARFGHSRYRGFYFFIMGKRIIITHGIVKNTDQVPPQEIERARRCRQDFEERLRQGDVSP